ncbi:MAG TPA: adenylyl-sulfate kinase, partial [Pyrinomonadaceae bacterium]|nr:adenylyl-sulfate kinase [Pyrinomonadaceae bacterium]
SLIGTDRFIEVFVNTPLEECERRDVKGMYQKARLGQLKNFTGIDDPYEPPVNPELELETLNNSAEENARLIIDYLKEQQFLV